MSVKSGTTDSFLFSTRPAATPGAVGSSQLVALAAAALATDVIQAVEEGGQGIARPATDGFVGSQVSLPPYLLGLASAAGPAGGSQTLASQATLAGGEGQALQPQPGGSLDISSSTAPTDVAQFLGPASAVPKIGVTKEGEAFLVFGTVTDPATGETLVRTANPQNPHGGTSDVPLGDFQKYIASVQVPVSSPTANLTVAGGSQVKDLLKDIPQLHPGDQVAFKGYFQDPNTKQILASLSDQTSGSRVDVPTAELGLLFGTSGQQSTIHDSLSGKTQALYKLRSTGGAAGDGFSIASSTTAADLDTWLSQGQSPALADLKGGGRALVQVGAAGSGNVELTPLSPPGAQPTTLSTADFLRQANYVDRATAGAGTALNASASAGGLKAGSAYTFQGLSQSADGQAAVALRGADGTTHTLSIADAQKALGQTGFANLIDSAQTEPAVPTSKASTYQKPSSDVFAPAGGDSAADVKQGAVGDCYFEAGVAGLAQQDPNFLHSIVRPSTDGNPNHVDVRFYPPTADGGPGKPVWVTVDTDLPTTANGKLVGSQVAHNADGTTDVAPAIIEKAFAVFNEQYHVTTSSGGYQGIDGGSPAKALQALTGQSAKSSLIDSKDILSSLQEANRGGTVVLGSNPSNSPVPGLAPNIIGSHAYTVLSTQTGPDGQPTVTLRNPWGLNTDAQGKPIKGTDGVFTLTLPEVQRYFLTASVVGPGVGAGGAA